MKGKNFVEFFSDTSRPFFLSSGAAVVYVTCQAIYHQSNIPHLVELFSTLFSHVMRTVANFRAWRAFISVTYTYAMFITSFGTFRPISR